MKAVQYAFEQNPTTTVETLSVEKHVRCFLEQMPKTCQILLTFSSIVRLQPHDLRLNNTSAPTISTDYIVATNNLLRIIDDKVLTLFRHLCENCSLAIRIFEHEACSKEKRIACVNDSINIFKAGANDFRILAEESLKLVIVIRSGGHSVEEVYEKEVTSGGLSNDEAQRLDELRRLVASGPERRKRFERACAELNKLHGAKKTLENQLSACQERINTIEVRIEPSKDHILDCESSDSKRAIQTSSSQSDDTYQRASGASGSSAQAGRAGRQQPNTTNRQGSGVEPEDKAKRYLRLQLKEAEKLRNELSTVEQLILEAQKDLNFSEADLMQEREEIGVLEKKSVISKRMVRKRRMRSVDLSEDAKSLARVVKGFQDASELWRVAAAAAIEIKKLISKQDKLVRDYVLQMGKTCMLSEKFFQQAVLQTLHKCVDMNSEEAKEMSTAKSEEQRMAAIQELVGIEIGTSF